MISRFYNQLMNSKIYHFGKIKAIKIAIFIMLIVIFILLIYSPSRKIVVVEDIYPKARKLRILIFGEFINRPLFREFDYMKCAELRRFEIIRSNSAVDFDAVVIFSLDMEKFYKVYKNSFTRKILILFLWVFIFLIGPAIYDKIYPRFSNFKKFILCLDVDISSR